MIVEPATASEILDAEPDAGLTVSQRAELLRRVPPLLKAGRASTCDCGETIAKAEPVFRGPDGQWRCLSCWLRLERRIVAEIRGRRG